MSLLAVLRKSGEIIASYDVPNHANNLSSLRESVRILQQEINQTLTSLVESDVTDGNASGDDDDAVDDDSEDGDAVSVNGKRKSTSDSTTNKKIKNI